MLYTNQSTSPIAKRPLGRIINSRPAPTLKLLPTPKFVRMVEDREGNGKGKRREGVSRVHVTLVMKSQSVSWKWER